MNLIEKKCPNCGASLEFSDTDKSCKCSYCHRAFEIERNNNQMENNNNLDLSQQYVLNEVNKGFKAFHIIFISIFIVVIVFIGFVFFNIFKSFSDNNFGPFNSGTAYYTDASELSNKDYQDIDFDAAMKIDDGEGVDTYTIDGTKKREKVYVAFKENSSIIVAAYKVNYYNVFQKDQRFTVYVPIYYENIDKNEFGDKFSNPQVKAPEFYFNSDKTSYTYGYASLDDLYNDLLKPLESKDYKITDK